MTNNQYKLFNKITKKHKKELKVCLYFKELESEGFDFPVDFISKLTSAITENCNSIDFYYFYCNRSDFSFQSCLEYLKNYYLEKVLTVRQVMMIILYEKDPEMFDSFYDWIKYQLKV